MSKESEALEVLFKNVPSKQWADENRTDEDLNGCDEVYEMHEAYELLKKAITRPTADEVCKALNDYFDNTLDIFYSEDENAFVYTSNNTKPHWVVYKDGRVISFNFDLPAYLVEMIGNFYGAQKNE